MSEERPSTAQVRRNSFKSSRSIDETLSRKAPMLPRPYQSTKNDLNSKAHPFATTTTLRTESTRAAAPVAPAVAERRQALSKPLMLPPSSAVKNGNPSPAKKGVASIVSNWENKRSLKRSSSDKSSSGRQSSKNPVNGNVSKMTEMFTQLTPSDSLKIDWKEASLCSHEGEYISNWITGGVPSQYENVEISGSRPSQYENAEIDKQVSTATTNHKPFVATPYAISDQTKGPTTCKPSSSQRDRDNAYEIVNYQPTTAHPVKLNMPNRRPMMPSVSPKTRKSIHTYVNVEIPSDPEPVPPPIPSKKKKPPVQMTVVNDQSNDSELDEEPGNESQYQNWSFLNVNEGDRNMTISELDAYVKSRKLQGLKLEYFKIRNKPDPSEMKIFK